MISDNIRNYRKANNMSQDELAEQLGVSRQSISLWETGQTQPTIDNIIALSKIFNISSDELLMSERKDTNVEDVKYSLDKMPEVDNKPWFLIAVGTAVLIVGIVILCIVLPGKNPKKDVINDFTENSSSEQSEVSEENRSSVSVNSDNKTNNSSSSVSDKINTGNSSNTSNKNNADSSASLSQESSASESFDLFTYCKNFAIEKGQLNGDYCIYQQPATKYDGFNNEYFSISYWGDSDMVEFCLHCPLDDTLSVNFYLRMRGGYNQKYEYLSSKYYRDNGESMRSASGTIDPSVFSDKYPLNCDSYIGSFEGQTEFMEESRVGICDLIKCLKVFVEKENLECEFSDFDFVNF